MSLDCEESVTTRDFGLGAKYDSIEAAGNRDSSKLERIIEKAQQLSTQDRSEFVLDSVRGDDESGGCWDTPLLRAIACGLLDNVKLLLKHGADPNGIDTQSQEEYSFRFRRLMQPGLSPQNLLRLIQAEEVGAAHAQTLPLVASEFEQRRDTVARFWVGRKAPPLDLATNGDRLHSLVMAAQTTPAIFDELLMAGADATFWRTPSQLPEAETLVPSMLCLSTPINNAISSGNRSMLDHLILCGFDVNARALIAGPQALSPIQHAVCLGNDEAYRKLIAQPSLQHSLLTPGYGVHLLHFAVAQLRPELLEMIEIPLTSAPATALGHTLAHIACLPFDETHIQRHAPKVRESIHDVRATSIPRVLNTLLLKAPLGHARRSEEPNCDGPGDPNARKPAFLGLPLEERRSSTASQRLTQIPTTEYFVPQTNVIKSLVEALGIEVFGTQDWFGNTPLHYLASERVINNDLIAWLRGHAAINETWKKTSNSLGHTPTDLWVDNVTVLETGDETSHRARRRGRGSSK